MMARMDDVLALKCREEKPPIWAVLAPAIYLLACAASVRSVMMDRSIDIGLYGLLVALGLAPAFSMPAIFSTRSTTISACDEGLLIDGSLQKINSARVGRADRGAGRLIVEMRNETTRTFLVPSYSDAQKLMAMLPPVSLPAGALAV
jgi:hypothetical protein